MKSEIIQKDNDPWWTDVAEKELLECFAVVSKSRNKTDGIGSLTLDHRSAENALKRVKNKTRLTIATEVFGHLWNLHKPEYSFRQDHLPWLSDPGAEFKHKLIASRGETEIRVAEKPLTIEQHGIRKEGLFVSSITRYNNQSLFHVLESLVLSSEKAKNTGFLFVLEMLSKISSLLSDEHRELEVKTSLQLNLVQTNPHTPGDYSLSKLVIKVGSVYLCFGYGPFRRGYGSLADYSSRMNCGFWMEMGTKDESIIVSDAGEVSFHRRKEISKLFPKENRNEAKVPCLVRMVWPDGKFIVDEGEEFDYLPFRDIKHSAYSPIIL